MSKHLGLGLSNSVADQYFRVVRLTRPIVNGGIEKQLGEDLALGRWAVSPVSTTTSRLSNTSGGGSVSSSVSPCLAICIQASSTMTAGVTS